MTDKMYSDLKLMCQEVENKRQQLRQEKQRILEVSIKDANDFLESQVLPKLIEAVKSERALILRESDNKCAVHYNQSKYEIMNVPENVMNFWRRTEFYKNLSQTIKFIYNSSEHLIMKQ